MNKHSRDHWFIDTVKNPRHLLYWLAVVIGIVFILLAVAGAWLNEQLESLYGSLRVWCYHERYGRRNIPRKEYENGR